MRERSVDQVGEHCFDDRVCPVHDIGGRRRQGAVGEKCVIPPHLKQRIAVARVFDPPDYQPCGDRVRGGREGGEDGFGASGVGDQP